MLPRMMMCRTGKNMVKSRFGVIQNWILDMHSNVPCILHTPSTKHSAHSRGRKVMCGASRLQAITPRAADDRRVLLVKRNFIRKRMGK